jgi:hypothetical protein
MIARATRVHLQSSRQVRWARAIMGRVDDYLGQVRQVDAMRCGGSVQSQLRDLTQEP